MAANADQQLSSAAEAIKNIGLDDPHATPKEEPKKEELKEAPKEEIKEEITEEESKPSEESQEDAGEDEVREAGAEQEPESIELEAEQLAEILGLENDNLVVNEDGSIRIRAKGEKDVEDVTLEQLVNAYQGNANLTNRSKEVAELRKQEEQKLEEFTQQTTQFAQHAAIRLEAINSQFETELGAIDWQKLKEEDPGQWSAKKVEMDQRKRQLDDLTRQTLEDINQAEQETAKQRAQLLQTKLANEQKAMHDGFKALNVKVDAELEKGIVDYMGKVFSQEEIAQMAPTMPLDRLSILAYKAMQFDKGRAKVETKKVKKVPKVLKPGAKVSPSKLKAQQDKELKQRHHKEGTMDSAVAAMKGLIN